MAPAYTTHPFILANITDKGLTLVLFRCFEATESLHISERPAGALCRLSLLSEVSISTDTCCPQGEGS